MYVVTFTANNHEGTRGTFIKRRCTASDRARNGENKQLNYLIFEDSYYDKLSALSITNTG